MFINYTVPLCMLISSLSLFAAGSDTCFNLVEYVPPAFKFHLLQFTPNFSMNGESTAKSDTYLSSGKNKAIVTQDSRSRFNNPEFGLQSWYNFDSWNGRTEWNINSDLSIAGRSRLHTPEKNTSGNPQRYTSDNDVYGNATGTILISADHYFRWPFFIGTQISPEVTARKIRSKQSRKGYETFRPTDITGSYFYMDDKSNQTDYDIGCNVSFRAGAGRIDDITFAVAALNMLDKIAAIEKSYTGCSAKKVQEFAELIEKIRKQRAFDSRIAFINNINTLCDFIKAHKIADEVSPRTVLELADQYNYVFYQNHLKGYSIALYPTVNHSRILSRRESSSTTYSQNVVSPYTLNENSYNDFDADESYSRYYDDGDRTNRFTGAINLSARYELPISRYYQLSLNSQVTGSIVRNRCWSWNSRDTESIEYSNAFPEISSLQSAGLAYYPNTRTSVEITESVTYNRTFDYYDIERSGADFFTLPSNDNFDDRELYASLNGEINYYFSPRLKAELFLGFHWRDHYLVSYGDPPWMVNDYSAVSQKDFTYSIGTNFTWSLF